LNSTNDPLPTLPNAELVTVSGVDVSLGGYLFRPSNSTAPVPAVLLLHGFGGNALATVEPAQFLAQDGYIALSLSMRGWQGSEGVDDCGLHQVADTVKALEWLAHQEGVNSERIGILGMSQGGQVALLAASRTRLPRAIIAYKPPTHIEQWIKTTAFPDIGANVARLCADNKFMERSPVFHAEKINAPVLLVHGDADTQVPTEQSVLMQSALRAAGKQVDLKLIQGATHSFGRDGLRMAWEWTMAFFTQHLPIQR
jgi:dipeptidyl aminopeptidase/acylaminoacyl peptidase